MSFHGELLRLLKTALHSVVDAACCRPQWPRSCFNSGGKSRNGVWCLFQRETVSIHSLCMPRKWPWASQEVLTILQDHSGRAVSITKRLYAGPFFYWKLCIYDRGRVLAMCGGGSWKEGLDTGIVRIGEILWTHRSQARISSEVGKEKWINFGFGLLNIWNRICTV